LLYELLSDEQDEDIWRYEEYAQLNMHQWLNGTIWL